MNKLLRQIRKHQPDIEALSEHVDGRLDATRAAAIEAHISTCNACQEAHAGLRNTRVLLASMPNDTHPRSFRLRQADVDAPSRVPRRGGSAAMRWAPALAGASAIIFVAVFGADLATRDSGGGAQFSSLESEQPVGMTAGDDGSGEGMVPAPGSAAPETAPATGNDEAADSGSPATTDTQAGTAQARGAVEPTGPPPNGDTPVAADSSGGPDADATAASSAGGSNFVPPTATPAALGVVPPDAIPPATEADADVEQFSHDDSDDGNRNAFLVVEITAAAIALLAGAAYVAWRWMQRGNAA